MVFTAESLSALYCEDRLVFFSTMQAPSSFEDAEQVLRPAHIRQCSKDDPPSPPPQPPPSPSGWSRAVLPNGVDVNESTVSIPLKVTHRFE